MHLTDNYLGWWMNSVPLLTSITCPCLFGRSAEGWMIYNFVTPAHLAVDSQSLGATEETGPLIFYLVEYPWLLHMAASGFPRAARESKLNGIIFLPVTQWVKHVTW